MRDIFKRLIQPLKSSPTIRLGKQSIFRLQNKLLENSKNYKNFFFKIAQIQIKGFKPHMVLIMSVC